MMLSRLVLDPLQGKTPLWQVAILYSAIGGGVLAVIGSFVARLGDTPMRIFMIAGLAYSTYVVIAVYRCADNCPWPALGRLVRLSAAISLLLIPIAVYLTLSGTI